MAARNGSAEWRSDIKNGSGTITVCSDLFKGAYSYGTRLGDEEGTNPEQLIAAAQAGCFTMALASILAIAGHTPESVRTNARVQLRMVDGAPTLTRLELEPERHVAGVYERHFQRYAEEAKATCPLAHALAGIPEIVVTARLAVLLVSVGIGFGLGLAFPLVRLSASLLYGVSTSDPLTFFSVPAALIAMAMLASCIPARHAAKVDLIVALRYESWALPEMWLASAHREDTPHGCCKIAIPLTTGQRT